MNQIQVYQSSKSGGWIEQCQPGSFRFDQEEQEMKLVMIYDDIEYQTVKGFGGAITESSAMTFARMNPDKQKEVLDYLFSDAGLRYTCARNAMGSCDFSRGDYSCCDQDGDTALESFNIAAELEYVIPMLKQSQSASGTEFTLMSTPWSPPSWMKTNGSMKNGGKLKGEYYDVWANYFVKYIEAYQKVGIEITYISIQNEPKAVQTWESCLFTAEEEKLFICDFLVPKLKGAGLSVKIVIWDHNKEAIFERARYILADSEVNEHVSAIAFHWYSGDHFENVRLCREMFPDKELIFTEGCVELTTTGTTMADKANAGELNNQDAQISPYEFGECYAHDILGNFNGGMDRYIDWNILLDQQGGPNHVGNYCSAPIICDLEKQEVLLQPSYYFISHFSRFIPNGSKRIAFSKYTDELEVTTFKTPEGEKIVIVMNTGNKDISYTLKDVSSKRIADFTAKAKSICTLVY